MFIYYWRTCKKLCAGRSVITSIFVSGNNFGGVICYLSDAFARPWPVTASHGLKIHFCSLASGTRAHVPPPHSPRAQLLHGRSCSNKQQQTDNLLPTLIIGCRRSKWSPPSKCCSADSDGGWCGGGGAAVLRQGGDPALGETFRSPSKFGIEPDPFLQPRG